MARILIVDDEESDRLLEQEILEQVGHETFFAADGEEAIREYLARGIDIVVTDPQMPKIHGLELITVLKDLAPRPAIIAVSGTGSDQLDMAEAVGAYATLTKPVDPTELLSAVALAVPGKA